MRNNKRGILLTAKQQRVGNSSQRNRKAQNAKRQNVILLAVEQQIAENRSQVEQQSAEYCSLRNDKTRNIAYS
jgi:hypothetical protein